MLVLVGAGTAALAGVGAAGEESGDVVRSIDGEVVGTGWAGWVGAAVGSAISISGVASVGVGVVPFMPFAITSSFPFSGSGKLREKVKSILGLGGKIEQASSS